MPTQSNAEVLEEARMAHGEMESQLKETKKRLENLRSLQKLLKADGGN